jgi:hypothetical protein
MVKVYRVSSTPHHGCALAHLAVAVLVVSGLSVGAPVTDGRAPARVAGFVQLAKGNQSRHFKESNNPDDDDNFGKNYPPLPRGSGGVKSSPSGYDPQRVKRFWSHYHGARPEKKEKSLERER